MTDLRTGRGLLSLALLAAFIVLLAILSVVTTRSQAGVELSPPLPEPVTMSATRVLPAGIDNTLLTDAVLPIDVAGWKDLLVGDLASESGARTDLARSAGELRVSTAPSAGLYHGSIHRDGPDGAESVGTIEVRVNDWIIWAAIAALAGLLLALRLEAWFSRDAPRGLLLARLAALRERSRELTEGERRSLDLVNEWVGSNRSPTEVVSADGKSGALAGMTSDALRDFDEQPTFELRERRWGSEGSQFPPMNRLVEAQEWHGTSGIEMNENFIELRTALASHAPEFARSSLGVEVTDQLHGKLEPTRKSWQKSQADRGSLRERLTGALTVAKALRLIESRSDIDATDRAEIDGLRRRLAGLPLSRREDIQGVASAAMGLYERITTRAHETMAPEDDVYDEVREQLSYVFGVDTGGGGDDRLVTASSHDVAAELTSTNRAYLWAASTAVLIAVMGSQYFANPTFGSLADYAAVFSWAFAATGVTQLAKWLAFARVAQNATRERTIGAAG